MGCQLSSIPRVAILTALIAWFGIPGIGGHWAATSVASGETVEARRSSSLMSSPGEQSPVVTRVRAGSKLEVINTKGRWLKVRVNGRTGWITQTNVVSRLDREPEAEPRRRQKEFVEGRPRTSRRRTAPRDRVGGDVVEDAFIDDESPPPRRGQVAASQEDDFEDEAEFQDTPEDADDDLGAIDSDLNEEEVDVEPEVEEVDEAVVVLRNVRMRTKPEAGAPAVTVLRTGEEVFMVERTGAWSKVENAGGRVGWIPSQDVESPGYRYERLRKNVGAALGYQSLGQSFTSNGAGALAGYNVSSGSALIGLRGDVLYDLNEKYLVGGDLSYQFVTASPGIAVNVDGMLSNVGYTIHEINASARGGYKLSKSSGLAGYARLGYHYGRMSIDQNPEVNIAQFPTEVLSGVTGGVQIELPRFKQKYSGRVTIDRLLLLGKRNQTSGLEDGQVSDPSAWWGSLMVDYQWRPKWTVGGVYRYYRASTSWDGAASRGTNATEASRKDTSHTLSVGVSRSL